jgi:hypothetical protein
LREISECTDHWIVAKLLALWSSLLIVALLTTSCSESSGRDGAPLPTLAENFPSHGSSIIEVRLVLDADTNCIYVEYDERRLPAVWPFGYAWTKDRAGVRSSDGKRTIRVGEVARVIGLRSHMGTLTVGGGSVLMTAPEPSCRSDGEAMLISGIV